MDNTGGYSLLYILNHISKGDYKNGDLIQR
jgi:hypothetical protein